MPTHMRCLVRPQWRIGFQLLVAYLLVGVGSRFLLVSFPGSRPEEESLVQNDMDMPLLDVIDSSQLKEGANIETAGKLPRKGKNALSPVDDYKYQSPTHSAVLEYLTRKLDGEKLRKDASVATLPTSFLATPIGNSTTYHQQYCNLQGKEWCPSGLDGWQRNAPFVMILGAKKAGTSSFWKSLVKHPQIVEGRTKELLFFSQNRFQTDVYLDSAQEGGRVRVHSIRRNYHEQEFRRVRALRDTGAISIDASPQYLINWPSAPRPILCSSPWVKLLVIVRHPTDRLWSHYNFMRTSSLKRLGKVFPPTFDDWLRKDLNILSQLGLVDKVKSDSGGRRPPRGSSDSLLSGDTYGSSTKLSDEEMAAAWSNYTSRSVESPVGRGFYALNLYQWFQELRRLGRDPHEALKIVRLEDLKDDDQLTSMVLSEIFEWLGLPPGTVSPPDGEKVNATGGANNGGFSHVMKSNYDGPDLSEATRELLDTFYTPYNKMLSRLLGDERWAYRRKETDDEFEAVVWPRNDQTNQSNGPLFQIPTEASISNVPCGGRNNGLTEFNDSVDDPFIPNSANDSSYPFWPSIPEVHYHNLARAFPSWSYNTSWCVPAELHRDGRPEGLIFAKVHKAASSTMAGIAARIAQRNAMTVANGTETIRIPCKSAHRHSRSMERYRTRDLARSFLFGIVRDPTQRALSYIFYRISNRNIAVTDKNLLTLLKNNTSHDQLRARTERDAGYQVGYLSTRPLPVRPLWDEKNPEMVAHLSIIQSRIKDVIDDYDFLLITERLDESLVVLQILLDLHPGDILYVRASKQSGQYSAVKNRCHRLVSIEPSAVVKDFLDSPEWYARNYGDFLLYRAANRSLDATIDRLGRERFNKALEHFRKLLAFSQEQCQREAVFPCSSEGKYQPQLSKKNCYELDWGCGYPCLDRLLSDTQSA
jgi:hypothetical protein